VGAKGYLPYELAAMREAAESMRPQYGLGFVINKDSLIVQATVQGQSAALAGIQQNDTLLEVNGVPTVSEHDFFRAIAGAMPGDVIPIKLRRTVDGHVESKAVELIVGAKGHTFEEIAAMRASAQEDTIKAMRSGSPFTMYQDNDPPQKIDLWLVDDQQDPAGCLCWGPVGLREQVAVKSMSIRSIFDLYFGKQAKAFHKSEAANACCFSLLNSDIVLNLEADSPRTLETWLQGIHHLVVAKAKKAVLHEKKGNIVPPAAIHELFGLNGNKTRVVEHPSVPIAGSDVTLFRSDNGNQELQAMWLAPEIGTIFWGVRNARSPDSRHSLRVDQITELLVGKLVPAFKSAQKARSRCCLTLRSAQHELNVEFTTQKELLDWLAAIQNILQRTGAYIEMGR
jgi:hypothetical protein